MSTLSKFQQTETILNNDAQMSVKGGAPVMSNPNAPLAMAAGIVQPIWSAINHIVHGVFKVVGLNGVYEGLPDAIIHSVADPLFQSVVGFAPIADQHQGKVAYLGGSTVARSKQQYQALNKKKSTQPIRKQ